jgi:hypothetical protein
LPESAATAKKKRSKPSGVTDEAREAAIARCAKLQSQIIDVGRPISAQMEESFKKMCKMLPEESLAKYPELQAQVDAQKALEKRFNDRLKAELARMLEENGLTEEDLKEF